MKSLFSKIKSGLKSGLALGVGLITTGLGFIGFGVSILAMSVGLVAAFAYALALAVVFLLCLLIYALVPALRFNMSTEETVQGDWRPEKIQEPRQVTTPHH